MNFPASAVGTAAKFCVSYDFDTRQLVIETDQTFGRAGPDFLTENRIGT